MSTKLNKNILQYECFLPLLNHLRQSLIIEEVSQADFARYLSISEKNLSEILNGRVVPNAAFFSYMLHIFDNYVAYTVFITWLEKNGKSSLSRFRSRKYFDLDLPFEHD